MTIFSPSISDIDDQIRDLQGRLDREAFTLDKWDLQMIVGRLKLMRDELSEFRWAKEQAARRASLQREDSRGPGGAHVPDSPRSPPQQ